MFWGREQDLAECVLISSSIVDSNSLTSYGNHTDSLRYMLKSIKGFIFLNLRSTLSTLVTIYQEYDDFSSLDEERI